MSLSKMTRVSSDILGTEMVSLIVGPRAKKFFIHKKLLCNRCEYFSNAFNSGFKEANSGFMTFPDDAEEAFTTFITWLYGGTNLLPEICTSEAADQGPYTRHFLEKYFLPSFILADKLCNHDLMNRLIDRLQDFQAKQRGEHQYFNATTTQLVFEEISSQSKLHLYFAANFACFLAKWNCKATRDSFVDKLAIKPEFLRALFEFQYENGDVLYSPEFTIWERYSSRRCYFHTHGEGEDCYLK